MRTVLTLAACGTVYFTTAVSAESTKQLLPRTTGTFEVPLTSQDRAGIRIRCDSGDGTACMAFLDCRDQSVPPEEFSGEVGGIVDQAVKEVTERDIAAMTDAADLKWPLHCEVRSTHPVKVMVLVRSEGIANPQWSTSTPGPGP